MASNRLLAATGALLLVFGLTACQPEDGPQAAKPLGPSRKAALQPPALPPTPPLREDFETTPKLSLFPRIGDYRPETGDEVALPFWDTYIEHLVRTAGVARFPDGSHAFAMRSVAGLESIGFFSPIAVEPNAAYRVSARFKTELPEGGSAGIGILEFDQFLWVAEQYPESLDKEHRTGEQFGLLLTGETDWTEKSFSFTTGPATRMIHLIFFREGSEARRPVLIDDIEIRPLQ